MKRPRILIKIAMSLNGKIGSGTSERVVFSNDADSKAVDKLRSQYDAMFIGETTLKKDNPRLTLKFPEHVRERLKRGLPEQPAKVTLSKSCDIEAKSNFFTLGNAEKFVFTTSLASEKNVERISAHAHVFRVGERRVDIKKMLAILYKHGIRRLMVEGGGRTNYEFLNAGCVDEMRVAISPQIIGGMNAPSFADGKNFLDMPNFCLKSVERLGGMVVLAYSMQG